MWQLSQQPLHDPASEAIDATSFEEASQICAAARPLLVDRGSSCWAIQSVTRDVMIVESQEQEWVPRQGRFVSDDLVTGLENAT